MRHCRRISLFYAFLSTLLLTACAARSRKPELQMTSSQLKSATKEELVARVNADSARIQTLNATVDIEASTGGSQKGKITEYQEIRGYILARKPGMLRMVGLFPVLRNRAFDMVSNGTTFRLWIPTKNRFIVGTNAVTQPSQQPLENLRPQHIYDALLLQPIDPENQIPVMEQGNEVLKDAKGKETALRPEYVLNIIQRGDKGWFLSRKIYFRRSDLEPYRQIVYDPNGYVATDAHYEAFQQYGEIEFPSQIMVWRPQEEYSVSIGILKLAVNAGLTDEQFALDQPSGAQLVRLDSPNADQASDGVSR